MTTIMMSVLGDDVMTLNDWQMQGLDHAQNNGNNREVGGI